MPNIEITNNDTSGPVLEGSVCRDELITFGGAGTLLAGTILARDSVSLKMVPFVVGGVVNENGIPKAILTYEVVAAGAGDVAARPAISGTFKKSELVIAADGNDVNITASVLDKLRDYDLIALVVQENAFQDNQ